MIVPYFRITCLSAPVNRMKGGFEIYLTLPMQVRLDNFLLVLIGQTPRCHLTLRRHPEKIALP